MTLFAIGYLAGGATVLFVLWLDSLLEERNALPVSREMCGNE